MYNLITMQSCVYTRLQEIGKDKYVFVFANLFSNICCGVYGVIIVAPVRQNLKLGAAVRAPGARTQPLVRQSRD